MSFQGLDACLISQDQIWKEKGDVSRSCPQYKMVKVLLLYVQH